MGLKGMKNRKSRRVPAARRYKVLKKIAASKKKKEKEAKKFPKKSAKKKLIQIPNICPFKEEILKDVEVEKQRREAEKQLKLEQMKLERDQKKKQSLKSLVDEATEKSANFQEKEQDTQEYSDIGTNKENSLKSYFKEFKKVVDAADVILEVVDSRDPIGTRCKEVAEFVREAAGRKKHVLILNKADLVPRENLDKWVQYFKKFGAVVPFKASTQSQKQNIGRKKFHKHRPVVQSSPCIGANLLMSLLANYCRNKDLKTSIRVGIVGIPNVGKSSIINSLKRRRACQVGATPGITKSMQEVEIDSNIKLIDSPGIIFQRPRHESPDEFFALKNAQHINTIQDPFPLAEDILKRATVMYFCKLYDITEYRSPEEFLAKKAIKMGKLLSKGVPDVRSAARSLISDWNTGKIKYCTQPPEENVKNCHISASFVLNTNQNVEFDIDNYKEIESKTFEELSQQFEVKEEVMEVETKGPVEIRKTKREMRQSYGNADIIEEDDDEEMAPVKSKKRKADKAVENDYDTNKLKADKIFRLEGNESINRNIKSSAKKLKKQKSRNEKKMSNVADELENFSLGASQDYDFDDDFKIE